MIKEKIDLFFKSFLGWDQNEEILWNQVPADLKSYCNKIFLYATALLIVNVFILFQGIRYPSSRLLGAFGVGFLVIVIIYLSLIYLYFKFRFQKFEVIKGVCIDMAWKFKLRGPNSILHNVFLKSQDGIVYKVTMKVKRGHLRVNDEMVVYVSDHSCYHEEDGIYVITNFYSAKKISITEQLSSKM